MRSLTPYPRLLIADDHSATMGGLAGKTKMFDIVQTLRDLFRQLSSASTRQELKISNVYVIPGHIFVATTSKDGIEPKGEYRCKGHTAGCSSDMYIE